MNKLIATLAAASMLVATQAPALASDYGKEVKPIGKISTKSHNNNAKFAAGLAIGALVVGTIIASQSKAQAYQHGDKCSTWLKDCRYGSDRACYKYDTRC